MGEGRWTVGRLRQALVCMANVVASGEGQLWPVCLFVSLPAPVFFLLAGDRFVCCLFCPSEKLVTFFFFSYSFSSCDLCVSVRMYVCLNTSLVLYYFFIFHV